MRSAVVGKNRGIPKNLLSSKVSSRMAEIRTSLLQDMLRAYVELIEQALRELILSTPVDTGRARLHWHVELKTQPIDFINWNYYEVEPRKRLPRNGNQELREQDDVLRATHELQFGDVTPMVVTHIQSEIRRIKPLLVQQLKSEGRTGVIFKNDLLYTKFLESEPHGMMHPLKPTMPWSDQNHGMITDVEAFLKQRGIPNMRMRLQSILEKYKPKKRQKKAS